MQSDLPWRDVRRLMWRWSLFSAALIAVFWGCWYWTTGSVPTEHLSRWADIAIGPLWTIAGFLSLKFVIATDSWDDDILIPFWLFAAWALGLLAGLGMGIVTGLMVSGIILGIFVTILLLCGIAMMTVWLLSLLPPIRWVASWLCGQ